ncbi:unnamed protein product [Caenorhabditis sp. 36 PRJEB53466]|nr:unnamed protein product [Caenorhabditis sp. 36 PRJEB53466]
MEKRTKRMEDGKRKGTEEENEAEWPEMPAGYRILSEEEQQLKMLEEERRNQEMKVTNTQTANDILADMQLAADGDLLSSFPPDTVDEPMETSGISDNLLSAFDDHNESPMACQIVVDTIPDDDELLFPEVPRM